ncbi:MAG: hypothetical protein K6T63_14200 [Alicyclobacillus herbarius]|uniref:hypothetical protein n=1 Tax=Alicyclobacillus herbarius TaxID=122960 RepID=UPI00235215FF|nr:hypothetical protein [Alicyclobacillus herbarius]MCL6633769.1 hypothetical protein [Alicyclobacillus herbarius]
MDKTRLLTDVISNKLVVTTGLLEMIRVKEVGAYEAKTHLVELLDEVMNGETIW